MKNLHNIILEQYGMEALSLFKDWEILQIRDCNYRNHRIFTLRCITKGLVPVSIKLKKKQSGQKRLGKLLEKQKNQGQVHQ